MIDLALDTALDAQMKLVERTTVQKKVMLEALKRGEVIGPDWAREHKILAYPQRISELRAENNDIKGGPLNGSNFYYYWMVVGSSNYMTGREEI